jgi:tRNA pseudouridine55 synthase
MDERKREILMEEKPFEKIILIDKPAGMSSFGVVARVRRKLRDELGKKIKVGHTGTLDPFATGLLIILAGKATKKSDEFLKKDKVYEATVKLGETSTTGDIEGEIEKVSDKVPTLDDIKKACDKLTGEITQTVPAYSAVKINGERAYKLARKGKEVEMPTRKVTIYELEILDYTYPNLKIRTHVSSGTYIRTLGEDIGKLLGTGAYLTALRRTKIADFSVEAALKLDEYML